MTTLDNYPVPLDDNGQDLEIEIEDKITEGVTYEIIWRDIFLDGNMPQLQNYIATRENIKSYVHWCCLYATNIMFRGISQVFLCNHPITGIFICIGLGLTSVDLMAHVMLGSSIGAAGAYIIGGFSVKDIENGLGGKVMWFIYFQLKISCVHYFSFLPSSHCSCQFVSIIL